MNWIVFHIVSGQSFFSGIVLILIAVAASRSARKLVNRFTVPSLLLGLTAVAVSSTPIPYLIYVIATFITIFWSMSWFKSTWRIHAAYAMLVIWIIAAFAELPWLFSLDIPKSRTQKIAVIGDSITAGVGGTEVKETWPNIIRRERGVQINDLSRAGATVSSALQRTTSSFANNSIVIVQIGGNDVLGSTSPGDFAANLEKLLARLEATQCRVLMFELPLPPFYHEFGRIQRNLSTRYGVTLIPKRHFLSVLAGDDATLDSIHLTQTGHRHMADLVWQYLKPAFD